MYDGPSSMNALSAFFACLLNFSSSMFFPSYLTHFLRSDLKLIIIGSNFRITFITCIVDAFLNDTFDLGLICAESICSLSWAWSSSYKVSSHLYHFSFTKVGLIIFLQFWNYFYCQLNVNLKRGNASHSADIYWE